MGGCHLLDDSALWLLQLAIEKPCSASSFPLQTAIKKTQSFHLVFLAL